jgi:hypothetical protein
MAQLMFKIANEPPMDIRGVNAAIPPVWSHSRPRDGEEPGRAIPDRRGVRRQRCAKHLPPL